MNDAPSSSPTSSLVIEFPAWVEDLVLGFPQPLVDDESRMALTVRLSAENVTRGGGPFGASVFLGEQLVAASVNRVLASGLSLAHAEIMALLRAQSVLGKAATLSAPPLTLFASTEPCCQCFGALVWAGVRRLVCGATTADAEAVGFDEGPKPDDWARVLERRGISVRQGLLREEAARVLTRYVEGGGPIYGKPAR